VHVSISSCEDICTTTQHYNAFQYFIVTAIKTHGYKVDLIRGVSNQFQQCEDIVYESIMNNIYC